MISSYYNLRLYAHVRNETSEMLSWNSLLLFFLLRRELIGIQHADNLCRITCHNAIIRSIFRYNGTGSDNRIPPDTDARQNDGVGADPGSFAAIIATSITSHSS
jgi:hypothetical protein